MWQCVEEKEEWLTAHLFPYLTLKSTKYFSKAIAQVILTVCHIACKQALRWGRGGEFE